MYTTSCKGGRRPLLYQVVLRDEIYHPISNPGQTFTRRGTKQDRSYHRYRPRGSETCQPMFFVSWKGGFPISPNQMGADLGRVVHPVQATVLCRLKARMVFCPHLGHILPANLSAARMAAQDSVGHRKVRLRITMLAQMVTTAGLRHVNFNPIRSHLTKV